MDKVIITFATSALAMRVIRILETKYECIKSTSEEVPVVLSKSYIKIPKGVNPTYAHTMLKLALDKHVKYILPLAIDEIKALSEAKLLFEEYDIQILCPDLAVLETMPIISNIPSELQISVYSNGEDLVKKEKISTLFSGLGVLSDDSEEVMLVVI